MLYYITRVEDKMPRKNELMKIIGDTYSKQEQSSDILKQRDVLIVVDIQKDFFLDKVIGIHDMESLITPLNKLIESAYTHGCLIVYARDWHPENHKSFKDWNPHCIQNTDGASFHPELYITKNATIVDIGSNDILLGYSAFDDKRLGDIVSKNDVGNIRVVASLNLKEKNITDC